MLKIALALVLAVLPAWSTWNTSKIADDRGYPVFTVDGKPFFVYGAAFFYERLPRDRWYPALQTYRIMGINTLDLYLIWNWHEPSRGVVDFRGKTDPRRDLLGLLAMAHQLGFKLILRPGPVIRNEWRNGGYPDWLLEQPEYNMPPHDVLEGRYPATATLQNAHADAAAQEWLQNSTHLQASAAWLHDALTAVAPYSRDVLAIALDDDQGAYLDNDTWPAPHWHAYVDWLRDTVRATTGDRVPLFINTFESKVTAAAPAWAWGDWYQSDAYTIGTHDLSQLDLATGLLGTQPHVPVMMAEFQAGWLQGADEAIPRPSDPRNTTVALNELLRDGAHGIVNFPVQDTIYPDGWEAPWANWSYAWDAALGYDLSESPRYSPTVLFGNDVQAYGAALARTHIAASAAIVWPPSLFEPGTLTNHDFAVFADDVVALQQRCAAARIACDLVDLRYADASALRRYEALAMPAVFDTASSQRMLPAMRTLLARLTKSGRLVTDLSSVHFHPRLTGASDATLLLADDGSYGFVAAVNPSDTPRVAGPMRVRLDRAIVDVAAVPLAPHAAALVPVRAPMSAVPPLDVLIATQHTDVPWQSAPGSARAYVAHLFEDSSNDVFMQNARIRLAFGPDAGARIALLQQAGGDANAATSIGLLRDAVDPVPSPSARDYIAAYTHPIVAGAFNRTYACTIGSASAARVSCSYDAPDLADGGARFERTLTLGADTDLVGIDETFTPHDAQSTARLSSVSGFAYVPGDIIVAPPGADYVGILHGNRLAWMRWHHDDVARHDVLASRGAAILTLVFAKRSVSFQFGISTVSSAAEAERLLGSS